MEHNYCCRWYHNQNITAEVAGYLKDDVSQEDLIRFKKALIEQYKEGVKSNGTWLHELQQVYFWGHDKRNFLNYEALVNAVTTEDIKATAKMLLANNQFKAATFPKQ